MPHCLVSVLVLGQEQWTSPVPPPPQHRRPFDPGHGWSPESGPIETNAQPINGEIAAQQRGVDVHSNPTRG